MLLPFLLGGVRMRRVVLSLVLAGALNSFGFAQQSSTSPQGDRLRDETTDWLKQMLVARARYVKSSPDGSTVEDIVDLVNFEGCNFNYRDTERSSGFNPFIRKFELTFIVPLTDLDLARVQVEPDADRAKLFLFTLGGKPTIKGTAKKYYGSSNLPDEESASQSRVVITFASLASANLVVPAFKQAIQLCQKQ